jgi:UDP-N-acetylmuramate dehydrogenase
MGGCVEIMVFPEDPVSLKNVMLVADRGKIPVFIFGAGTNLLVKDGRIRGIAVSLKAFRNIEFIKETDDKKVILFVGAGVPLQNLINFTKKNGYSGIEALAGIPGSFGGAVYMNAGSFGTEIKDVIVSVAVMNRKGEIMIFEKDKLKFSYRSSNLPDDLIILSANIVLKKDNPKDVTKRIEKFLREKKATQPLWESSAGCIFKNPKGDSAGRLIDAAGCKGMRVGDLEVSTVHANYFINKGRATYKDFIKLMNTVKRKVKRYSGVTLEPEIKIIGRTN